MELRKEESVTVISHVSFKPKKSGRQKFYLISLLLNKFCLRRSSMI